MKILIVTANYYPNVNGASYSSQRLAHYLKARGHDVLVMAQSKSMRHESFQHNEIEVFGIASVSLSFVYQDFRYPLGVGIYSIVKRKIQRFQPDVIHLQDHFVIGPVVVKVARELKIPVVGTNHFMPENLLHYLHLPKPIEDKVKQFGWWQFRKTYGQLQAVTTPTQKAADLLKHIQLTREVIPLSNGIDLARFHPGKRGEYLRKRFQLPAAGIMLYVGRLDKEKNLDFIIRSMPAVLKHSSVHFLIAGKGQEAAKLKKLATELQLNKNITFTGFISDEELPDLYTIADCFVIAGIAELQSIVTMEAMATGLPVVAVDAMALPELVHSGENGYLFARDNQEQFTEAVVKIFQDDKLRKLMGEQSLSIIHEHDINKVMAHFESLYQEVIGAHHV